MASPKEMQINPPQPRRAASTNPGSERLPQGTGGNPSTAGRGGRGGPNKATTASPTVESPR